MSREEGLLEFLAHQVGASYISDLRKDDFHRELINCIEKIKSTDYPINEWVDVLDYLTGIKRRIESPEEGKEALLEVL